MRRHILNSAVLKKLAAIVGPANLTTLPEELMCYSYDGTAQEFLPTAVAFPASTEEISAIMRLASATPFPVVPRGAGTGMTGGSLPIHGGLVLVMSRLAGILEIDRENQIAVVEPGVITGHFQAEVNRLGLYYPPDPASANFCTLGGNVAECAGGPSAVKYGVTRDYVLGLTVVLPDGRIIHTGVRTAKGVVGYDLTRLFVGSEGTLGIITSITLRLIALPPATATFLLAAGSMAAAVTAVARILAKHQPRTLEYIDRTALAMISAKLPFSLPPETAALLLLELDGDPQALALESKKLIAFLHAEQAFIEIRQAADQTEANALWAARRSISPAAFQLRPHKISEDVVVPRTRIPDLVLFLEDLARELNLVIFSFGHAGDGNIHVNIMLDKGNPQEQAQTQIAKQRLFAEVIRLGGTLSGEHGIGITKAAYLGLELDNNTLSVMQGIKTLFDPKNILNPGKIFPEDE